MEILYEVGRRKILGLSLVKDPGVDAGSPCWSWLGWSWLELDESVRGWQKRIIKLKFVLLVIKFLF